MWISVSECKWQKGLAWLRWFGWFLTVCHCGLRSARSLWWRSPHRLEQEPHRPNLRKCFMLLLLHQQQRPNWNKEPLRLRSLTNITVVLITYLMQTHWVLNCTIYLPSLIGDTASSVFCLFWPLSERTLAFIALVLWASCHSRGDSLNRSSLYLL